MAIDPTDPTRPDRALKLADVQNDPVAVSILAAIMTVALLSPVLGDDKELREHTLAQTVLKAAATVREELGAAKTLEEHLKEFDL